MRDREDLGTPAGWTAERSSCCGRSPIQVLTRLACVALTVASVQAWADFTGKVVSVHDGDTLTVLVDRKQIRVRLVDIDAPELGQPFGKRSRQSLTALCAGQQAQVEDKGKDRYRRTLGGVTCAGVVANIERVRTGMAWVYERYVKAGSPLYGLQEEAKEQRRGLWSDARRVPPWEWRQTKTRPK